MSARAITGLDLPGHWPHSVVTGHLSLSPGGSETKAQLQMRGGPSSPAARDIGLKAWPAAHSHVCHLFSLSLLCSGLNLQREGKGTSSEALWEESRGAERRPGSAGCGGPYSPIGFPVWMSMIKPGAWFPHRIWYSAARGTPRSRPCPAGRAGVLQLREEHGWSERRGGLTGRRGRARCSAGGVAGGSTWGTPRTRMAPGEGLTHVHAHEKAHAHTRGTCVLVQTQPYAQCTAPLQRRHPRSTRTSLHPPFR